MEVKEGIAKIFVEIVKIIGDNFVDNPLSITHRLLVLSDIRILQSVLFMIILYQRSEYSDWISRQNAQSALPGISEKGRTVADVL